MLGGQAGYAADFHTLARQLVVAAGVSAVQDPATADSLSALADAAVELRRSVPAREPPAETGNQFSVVKRATPFGSSNAGATERSSSVAAPVLNYGQLFQCRLCKTITCCEERGAPAHDDTCEKRSGLSAG